MCAAERERRAERIGVVISLSLVAFAFASALLLPAGDTRDFARLAGWTVVAALGSVFLHELGHAVVGRLVGLRILTISFGSGPVMKRLRAFDADIELRSLPTCGFVRTGPPTGAHPRLQGFLCTAGGPAVNALLLLLAWCSLDSFAARTVQEASVWHAVFAINAASLVFNLVPFSFGETDAAGVSTSQPNDGLLMLLQLFQPRESLRRWYQVGMVEEVDQMIAAGALADAAKHVDRLDARFPYEPAVVVTAARVAAAGGDRDGAIERLRALVGRYDLPGQARLLGRAALAELLLDSDSRRDLIEAGRLTEAALHVDPTSIRLRVLRGRALLATGWVEQAREVLTGALKIEERESDHATIVQLLAEVEQQAGDDEAAERYRDLARRLRSPG